MSAIITDKITKVASPLTPKSICVSKYSFYEKIKFVSFFIYGVKIFVLKHSS